MLLVVKNGRGDVLGDMVGNIIAENEGNGLTLAHFDRGDYALAQHARLENLLETDLWTGARVLLSLVNVDIELQFDVLAVEDDCLAL